MWSEAGVCFRALCLCVGPGGGVQKRGRRGRTRRGPSLRAGKLQVANVHYTIISIHYMSLTSDPSHQRDFSPVVLCVFQWWRAEDDFVQTGEGSGENGSPSVHCTYHRSLCITLIRTR